MITSKYTHIRSLIARCYPYIVAVALSLCFLFPADTVWAFWTELHELVTSEATLVPQVPRELFLYAGSPGNKSFHYKDTLSEGAFDEDADRDPRLGGGVLTWWGFLNWGTHFWDPEGGPTGGLLTNVGGFPVNLESENAYQRARDLYGIAKYLYDQDPGTAYYLLGKVSHLLTDMATPAHVNLDPHVSDESTTGDDSLEEYTGIKFASSGAPAFESAFSVSTISPPVPENLPDGGYSGEPLLFKIFYSLATFSRTFDSDDVDGTVDQGALRGRSIHVLHTDLKSVYAFRAGYPDIQLTEGFDLSASRHKFVLLDSVIRSLTGGAVPFEGIRLQFGDVSESHAFSEFRRTDIEDHDLETMASRLIPDAIGYTAALYRNFWIDTHPSLTGVLPEVVFDKAARDRRVTRPDPLEFSIDVAAHGWDGMDADVYVWAELVSPDGQYRLYYAGEWVPFEKVTDIRPAISHFPLFEVRDADWQVLGDTSPLPAVRIVLHLCLAKSAGGSFIPSESVCGGTSVSIE